jgi:hypothetical protein
MSKKVVTKAEFEKRVEMEFCYLVYINYMRKEEAWNKARATISELYQVE